MNSLSSFPIADNCIVGFSQPCSLPFPTAGLGDFNFAKDASDIFYGKMIDYQVFYFWHALKLSLSESVDGPLRRYYVLTARLLYHQWRIN